MMTILKDEELEKIYKDLGFVNLHRFKAFLGSFNNLDDYNEDEWINEEFYKFASKEFNKRLDKLNIDLANKSVEEQILFVIEITKQISKEYLLNKFKGRIDSEMAEKLVEYGYTHGSCNSLVYTLATLFKVETKLFKVESYGHQCIMLNGKCFDINGCSTVEEMKAFVSAEGSESVDKCEFIDFEPQKNAHKALDYFITRYFKDVLNATPDAELCL